MARIRPKSYEVLITPLVSKDTYGTTLNITKDVKIDDYVLDNGVGSIKREVDNGDFDFGIFVFDNINLSCINLNGKFSDTNDSRSMFKYTRDKAKVVVNYYDGISNTATLSFRGLIDDRATKQEFNKSEIKFKILSNDSIINRTKISSGVINNGVLISSAIKSILNVPEITTVLNYDPANINVLNDYTIDDGTKFDNRSVKQGLDKLLAASNSVLVIDKDTDEIIVRSREFNSGSVKNLYGHGDLFGRENIIDIKNYNTGLQRAFNTIRVGEQAASDLGAIDAFGDNPKNVEFDFITDQNKQAQIAQDLLNYWKIPKTELEVVVTTNEAKNLKEFDLVSVDFPYRVKPYGNAKLPIYGQALYGSAVYPYIFGNLKIRDNVAFKVIGINENPKKLETTLKLRQVGTTIDDGYFSKLGTFYGSALYGFSQYQLDVNRTDPNIKSVYGAALFGTVHYGNV